MHWLYLATEFQDSTIRRTLMEHGENVLTAAFSPDNKQIPFGSTDKTNLENSRSLQIQS